MNAGSGSGRAVGLIAGVFFCLSGIGDLGAEERVSFSNARGEPRQAVYVPATGTNDSPRPAVVLLHGCAGLFTKSGKIRARERAWMDILHKEGWTLLLPASFASRGHGSLCSIKNRPVRPDSDRPYDAQAALEFLAAKPEIDKRRIALMGWSNGAMTGLHVIRDGSPASPGNGPPDFRTAVLFYPGCIAIGKTYANYRPRVPTLIQHGALDDWTLSEPCRALVRRAAATDGAPPMFIDIYPNAYHNFDHPNSKLRTITTRHSGYATGERTVHTGTNAEAREKAIKRTLEWLRAHLS